jgi:hypothetical protein
MALAYAEHVRYAETFILSAQHGLIRPDVELEPYDLAIGDFSQEERAEWAHHVGLWQWEEATGLDPEAPFWRGVTVVLLASPFYMPQLPDFVESRVEQPMAGMQVGERLAWLKTQLAATPADLWRAA